MPYLKGETDLKSAKQQIIKNTKDFAKRQIRTFRSKLKEKEWYRIDVSNYTKNEVLDTIIKKISMEEKDEHTG
ncbi:MAG: hypothetical protein Q9M89_05160 [Persephonella sp.]|nr:hypothetical protein [Persephonella sp.]